MKPFSHRVALAALLLLGPATSRAEDPPAALDPLVAVATRTARPASEALLEVVVIERADIERALAADLSDLLRFTAGIEVGRNGGPGQTASLFVRGTESNHVLVLLDGVELNPGTIGGAPLSAIPLSGIERIEVVFGPRSTLYGSEAIGGVINIITKRGSERIRAAASATAGPDGTRRFAASAGGARGALDLTFDGERSATDGYRIQPASPVERGNDRQSGTAALGWRSGLWDARLRLFASSGTQEYLDFSGAPVSQSFDDRVSSLTVARDDGLWRSTLQAAFYADRIVQDQPNPYTTATDFVRTDRRSLDWQNDVGFGRHALTLGAAWSGEDSAAEAFGAYRESTDVAALYVQDRVRLGETELGAALRRTWHSTAGDHLSWNLELGQPLVGGWRASANAGAGFRAPDSTDRYSPCCGNPALEPERAHHLELAATNGEVLGGSLRLAAYRTRIDGLISFGPSFVLENIDRARITGLEAGWRVAAPAWGLELRALVQDTEDLATGEPLPRRADRSLSVRFHREHGRFGWGLDALASSGTKDSSFSSVRNAGYALVDLTASWRATDAWTVRARLENALDRDYVTAAGYANPGRGAFLGLEAAW
jgi:vitamin B12 transporter